MVSRLGERGVRVSNGFAITAQAYFDFLSTIFLMDQAVQTPVSVRSLISASFGLGENVIKGVVNLYEFCVFRGC